MTTTLQLLTQFDPADLQLGAAALRYQGTESTGQTRNEFFEAAERLEDLAVLLSERLVNGR